MNAIKSNIHSATAFAPATCANVAVGFDILGFAIENVGDTVTLTRRSDSRFVIDKIDSKDVIPLDPDKNTASIAVKKICQDLNLTIGFSFRIQKGIPLSSGMGGSAASAIATLVAFNKFLSCPISNHEIIQYALLGEEITSGHRHADNIVPCLYGGFTLIHATNTLEVIPLPIPDLFCVIVHPHLHVATKEARSVLKDQLSLKDHVTQSANLAATIAALYRKDDALLQKVLCDILIEPQRAHFVPGFYRIKNAALQAGALAVSFSGSGPSLFALAKSKKIADTVCAIMTENFKNIGSDTWISRIALKGAHSVSVIRGIDHALCK